MTAAACASLWILDPAYFWQQVAVLLARKPAARVASALQQVYALALAAGGLTGGCAAGVLRDLLAAPSDERQAALAARYQQEIAA